MGKSGLSAEWTYTGFIPADVRAKWDCADVNVSEERRTLSAAWLNAIASGAIVTGLIAPTIAVILNLANVALGWPLILMSLAWLAIGCAYIGWRGVCSEAATMPPLETYTYFVLPALVLAIGIGTVWLTRRDARRHTPAG
jgi:hypothetical protein